MYGVIEASVFNFTIFVIGLAGIPGFILRYQINSETQEIDNQVKKQKADIKSHGKKVEVNLTKCEVISANWVPEKPRYDEYRIQAWNAIGGDAELNVERNDHHI